jgi:alpha-mannosidase
MDGSPGFKPSRWHRSDYWHTNYRAGQGGDFTFRYALTSAPQLDGAALTRLGIEEMRPAELDYVVSQDKPGDPPRPLPAGGADFLQSTGPNVALVTWKKAENDNGTILRLQEIAGKPGETSLRLPNANVGSAWLCSGVEDNLQSLPVENNTVHLTFRPFEVLTVRLVTH